MAAAAAVLLLVPGSGTRQGPTVRSPPAPPRDLGPRTTRALRPIVAEPGRGGVRSNPLEPVDGGVRPAPPDRIAIPAAHVDTVVDAVGTSRDNAIEVPPLGRAGWYDGGPRPGERGRAVIIGHLDTNRGPGLFARVPALEQGDPIDVTDRRGDVFHYRVTARSEVRKDSFPTAEVYGGDRDRVLVLVTCGGPFDPASGYRDNIVVFARAA